MAGNIGEHFQICGDLHVEYLWSDERS